MPNQEHQGKLGIQQAQINNVNDLSIASTDETDSSNLNSQKLQLQFKGGAARLGLSNGGMN